jgi:predicted AlkP superfamily pyrophosphatase or phosphodiesterase
MKTLLILSDGMRPDFMQDHSLTGYLKKNGTYCTDAQTVMPSVTLPCHMSLFHSVGPERHGITTNTYMPQVRPIEGLCEVLNKVGQSCAMLFNWEQIRDLARPGSACRSEYHSGKKYGYPDSNRYLCERTKEWLKGSDIDFAFLYLGWQDAAGHDFGWGSEEYIFSQNETLDMVADIMAVLDNEYNIILTADHGGHGRSHGTDCPEDMTIPIFFLGEGFEKGRELHGLSIKDIAPTIAAMHGAEIPEEWEGNIVR